MDTGRNGKSLGDIVQRVRFKGLLPGSRLRNELITSLCIGNESGCKIISGNGAIKDEGGHLVLENNFFHF